MCSHTKLPEKQVSQGCPSTEGSPQGLAAGKHQEGTVKGVWGQEVPLKGRWGGGGLWCGDTEQRAGLMGSRAG